MCRVRATYLAPFARVASRSLARTSGVVTTPSLDAAPSTFPPPARQHEALRPTITTTATTTASTASAARRGFIYRVNSP
jgi:hypothetical protein